MVYDTRKVLCKLLGIKRPSNIVFTANATESINTALKGYLEPGDRVLTTRYEHNAVWRPLKSLEKYEVVLGKPVSMRDLTEEHYRIADQVAEVIGRKVEAF